MPPAWRKLPLPPQEGLPPLLFKYITTPNSYDIYLTDLTYIWSERLNRRAILDRASDENTSIDPSEDSEQFKVLLEKIEDALRGSPGSSITLNNGSKANSLELTTTTKLPSPLPPLQWTLYLLREPQTSLTSELLLPLLREEADRETRQRSLLDHLKEKDWVLRKLFDKIESLGIDPSTVFPSAAAGLRSAKRGSITLSQAAKYIKGLAPFDEEEWRNEVGGGNAESGLAPNLVGELSDATLGLRRFGPAPDKWWESLDIRGPAPEAGKQKKVMATRAAKSPTTETRRDDVTEDEESEDEFQRQETPPRIREAKLQRQQLEQTGKAQTKERREETPTPSPSLPLQQPTPKAKPKGLGTIGVRRAAAKMEEHPPVLRASSTASNVSKPPKAPPPVPPRVPTDQETESEEEPKPPQRRRPSPVSRPKAKQKQAEMPVSDQETESDEEETPPPRRPKPLAKPKQMEPPAQRQETESDEEVPDLSQRRRQQPSPALQAKETEPSTRDQETESDEESPPRQRPSPAPEAKREAEPPAATKKRGLGVIGGGRKKAKEPSPPSQPPPPTSPDRETTTTTQSPQKSKRPGGILGVIGGGKPSREKEKKDIPSPTSHAPSTAPGAEAEDDDLDTASTGVNKKPPPPSLSRSPSPSKAQPVKQEPEQPKREETAQEKADRKREELKRQLEAKSKAPAKKKRKF
ncbi:hypothetical protein VTN00DRAFT_575 [Thermoascus crustaceus]|uniref:uncharacterized protein n=1 Tax=Thermoascus crustaceus TaxID=5088 RepID=UPI003742706F